MAEFVKTEWVNGAAPGISAQELNRMEQGIYEAHNPICVMVEKTSVQTTIAASEIITFNTAALYDPEGRWNGIDKISLVPGIYLITAQLGVAAGQAGGYVETNGLYIAGKARSQQLTTVGSDILILSGLVKVTSNTEVNLTTKNFSSNITIGGAYSETRWCVVRVGS